MFYAFHLVAIRVCVSLELLRSGASGEGWRWRRDEVIQKVVKAIIPANGIAAFQGGDWSVTLLLNESENQMLSETRRFVS
jgi:hypothetical protein